MSSLKSSSKRALTSAKEASGASSQKKDCQKKLYSLNPEKEKKEIEVHQTKRKKQVLVFGANDIEREVRERLAHKTCSSYVGLWLLIPEHLRLGSWDLVKGWSGGDDFSLQPRIAMQIVHEVPLCGISGVRPRNTLCRRGFDLLNGLPGIVTDKMVHEMLDRHTVSQAKTLQQISPTPF